MVEAVSVVMSSLSLLISSSHLIFKRVKHCNIGKCFICDCYKTEDGTADENKDINELFTRIDTAITLLQEVKQTPRTKLKEMIKTKPQMEKEDLTTS